MTRWRIAGIEASARVAVGGGGGTGDDAIARTEEAWLSVMVRVVAAAGRPLAPGRVLDNGGP